eukprot:8649207-Heterocapsa_arctica.AAC.1
MPQRGRVVTAAMHCRFSSRHVKPISRPRACENRSTIGIASCFSPLAIEMYSASQVLDAVEPCRFDRQARGQQ